MDDADMQEMKEEEMGFEPPRQASGKPRGEKQKRLSKEEAAKEAERKERIEVIKRFTKELLKKYGPLIRSVVLFGSTARDSFRGESDIDVFIIIDDTRQRISPMFREQMEDEMEVISKKCSPKLSLQQPYMLTEFWQMVRMGHPIVFNFIREGIPVFDRDVFLPIKRLLQMGEIRPSREAVEKYIERGPKRIKRVENAKIYMVVEDCYYAMLESAQAVLMFLGKDPPRPVDAPEALRKTLVKMKLLDEKTVNSLEDITELRKEVEHKRVNDIAGADLDAWIEKTKAFVKKMQGLIVKVEILKRENMIDKSHEIMTETTLTLLKALDRLPAKTESIAAAFEKHLVRPGLIDKKYLDIYNELEKLKVMVKEGKVLDLEKQHLLEQREYVRKFIREAGKILKKNAKAQAGIQE